MSRGTQVHAVRVSPELWERARAAATERGETVSDVIRRGLENESRVAVLRWALGNAVEGMREMIGYADPYFQDKYDLDGYIQRAADTLALTPPCDRHCEPLACPRCGT